MGQSITIACPSGWTLTSFVTSFEVLNYDKSGDIASFNNQLQIVARDARWKVVINQVSDAQAAAEEYAANEDLDADFSREVGRLQFFIVTFNDIERTRRFLRHLAHEATVRGERMWIDTDYGWVISASELLKKLEQDPHWDWRAQFTPAK